VNDASRFGPQIELVDAVPSARAARHSWRRHFSEVERLALVIECDAHRIVQPVQQHRRLAVHPLQEDASGLARPVQTPVARDHDVGGLGFTLVQNDFGVSVGNRNSIAGVGNSRIRDFGEIDIPVLADGYS
jgi:hypothetical protein